MSNIPATTSAIESALVLGDLSKLTTDQRLSYFKSVCESVGLNPLTKPFEYITLNGKLTLYAKRDATDQLRKVHGVSITISAREKIEDVYIVTARAKDKTGREDESTGAVNVAGLKGESLANAFMKAETKAKRRVTLSVCGLGLLDETEVADIPEIREQAGTNYAAQIGEKIISPLKKSEDKDELEVGCFVVPFGKHKGIALKSMDILELDNYVNWMKDSSAKQSKPLGGLQREFIEHADAYLLSQKSTADLFFDGLEDSK